MQIKTQQRTTLYGCNPLIPASRLEDVMVYWTLIDVCLLQSTTIWLLTLTKLEQQLMSTQEDKQLYWEGEYPLMCKNIPILSLKQRCSEIVMQIWEEIAFTSKTKPNYHKEGGVEHFVLRWRTKCRGHNSKTEVETIQLSILTQNTGFSYHLYTHMHQIRNLSNILCSPHLICKYTFRNSGQ